MISCSYLRRSIKRYINLTIAWNAIPMCGRATRQADKRGQVGGQVRGQAGGQAGPGGQAFEQAGRNTDGRAGRRAGRPVGVNNSYGSSFLSCCTVLSPYLRPMRRLASYTVFEGFTVA